MNNITGILIAGGRSTRMGENKALLPFGDVPMAVRMVQILREVCQDAIAIVNDDEVREFLDVPCYSDILVGVGPLGGLHAACHYSPTERFLIVPCDMPMISPDLLRYMIQYSRFGNVVIPYAEGRIHPLIGVYARVLEDRVQRAIECGVQSMHDFLKGQFPVEVNVDGLDCLKANQLANLNTKEEFARCAAQRERILSAQRNSS